MHIPFLSSEYIFARPEWLLALLLLPLLAIWRSKHGRTPAVRFSGASLLSGLGSPARSTWGRFFFGLFSPFQGPGLKFRTVLNKGLKPLLARLSGGATVPGASIVLAG